MAELADAELAELKQAHALLKSLYADAGEGMNFRKLVKKVFPKASIPELDAITKTEELSTEIEKKLEARGSAIDKKIDEFLAAQAKKEEDSSVQAFEARIKKLVADRGYTEEGQTKLLQLMKERNIHDPEDAAIIFESRQPKEQKKPRQFSSRMNFITPDGKDDAQYQKLMNDPEQYMVDELMNAIQFQGEE